MRMPGLTKKQLRMLNSIARMTRHGQTVSIASVAAELGVARSSAQGMMHHLDSLGMLRRPTITVQGKWELTDDGEVELSQAASPD